MLAGPLATVRWDLVTERPVQGRGGLPFPWCFTVSGAVLGPEGPRGKYVPPGNQNPRPRPAPWEWPPLSPARGSCLCQLLWASVFSCAIGIWMPGSQRAPRCRARATGCTEGPRVQGQGDQVHRLPPSRGLSHSVGAGWPKDGQRVEVLLASPPITGWSVSFFLKLVRPWSSGRTSRSCTRHPHLRGPAARTDCARSGSVPTCWAKVPHPLLHFPILQERSLPPPPRPRPLHH